MSISWIIHAQCFAGISASDELVRMQINHDSIDTSITRRTSAPPANKARNAKTPYGTIDIPRTSRGNGAGAPGQLNGLVEATTFTQMRDTLTLHRSASHSAEAQSAPAISNTIDITIACESGRPDAQAAAAALHAIFSAAGLLAQGHEMVQECADFSEVVSLLTSDGSVKSDDILRQHERGFGSTGSSGMAGQSLPGTVADLKSLDDALAQFIDPKLVADRRLDTVLLRCGGEQIAQLKAKIGTFYQPVGSVILETELIETTRSGTKSLGIDFSNGDGVPQQVQYMSASVTLQIAPRITRNGYVISHVFLGRAGRARHITGLSHKELTRVGNLRDPPRSRNLCHRLPDSRFGAERQQADTRRRADRSPELTFWK